MPSSVEPVSVSKKLFWAGWVLSILPVLLLLMSAVMKLMKPAPVVDGFTRFGIPERLIIALGIVELVITVIYLVPRTAVLGAILLTGYLGGAVLTNLRVGEAWYAPALLGVVIWGGLFLRDPRVRALIPWCR